MFPIVVLVGKSGSGKSSIEKGLVETYKWHKVVSLTTRPQRDNEIDGVDYHFVTNEQFEQCLHDGELIEHAEYRGWHYGIHKFEMVNDNINIIVAEPHGYHQIIEKYPKQVMGFYVDCSDAERILRMLKREIDSVDLYSVVNEIIRRFPNDEIDFKDIIYELDYGVVNENKGDLEFAIDFIYDITMIKNIESDDRKDEIRGYLN